MGTTNGDMRWLLENKEVIEEIKRHLWLESEKAGHDIGFEKAAEDWLSKYAVEWVKFHMPEKLAKTRQSRTSVVKTRRASSYLKA